MIDDNELETTRILNPIHDIGYRRISGSDIGDIGVGYRGYRGRTTVTKLNYGDKGRF
jgi:hypothetical protein